MGSRTLGQGRRGWCSRKDETNSRSKLRVRGRPEPTAKCFDDAAANRETHAHAVRLRREEGIEDPSSMGRIDARPHINNSNLDLCPVRTARGDRQSSRTVIDVRHRIDRVGDEIDQNLLQLYAIADYLR